MFIEIIFVVMLVIFYIKIYSTIMTLVLVLEKKKKLNMMIQKKKKKKKLNIILDIEFLVEINFLLYRKEL